MDRAKLCERSEEKKSVAKSQHIELFLFIRSCADTADIHVLFVPKTGVFSGQYNIPKIPTAMQHLYTTNN